MWCTTSSIITFNYTKDVIYSLDITLTLPYIYSSYRYLYLIYIDSFITIQLHIYKCYKPYY